MRMIKCKIMIAEDNACVEGELEREAKKDVLSHVYFAADSFLLDYSSIIMSARRSCIPCSSCISCEAPARSHDERARADSKRNRGEECVIEREGRYVGGLLIKNRYR